MPTLKEQLSEKIKSSMKSQDKSTLGFARSLHAAIRKKEVDERVDLDDAGVQKVVSTLVKQRQDSIQQFKQGNRMDLVEAEEAELAFLMTFLPAQMSAAEMEAAIDQAISESQAQGPKDMGKVMKVLTPKVQGKADMKQVSQILKAKLEPKA